MLFGPKTSGSRPNNMVPLSKKETLSRKHTAAQEAIIRTSHESVEQLKSKYVYGKLN